MRYTVITTPEAEASITDAFVFLAVQAPRNAERWLRGLSTAIESLELFPGRCAMARESRQTGADLRQLIYKSHRIVFRIETEIVRVLYVRHVAQRPVGETDDET